MMDVFMPFYQVKNCNFGVTKANATGSTGVGYELLDSSGSIVVSRTTTDVYQTAPGIYGANVLFPDSFRGHILWDTGTFFSKTYYATEEYNYEDNNPMLSDVYSQVLLISSSVDSSIAAANQAAINAYGAFTKAAQVSGSIQNLNVNIDFLTSSLNNINSTLQSLYDIQFGRWHVVGNQMIYYKEDNITEVARFNLLDDAGVPTEDAVFERVRI